ncbi:MAG: HNH endonuclease [Thermoplasmata archaeon]|nr:HNH endonuclease [Thermoplasmata archaeon]
MTAATSLPAPLIVRGRLLRDSRAWFTEGAELKRSARHARRCVECRRVLPDRRTPYCSRRCQWSFRGRFFWDAARSFVLFRDRYTCQICRRRQRARSLEVDHIVEIARGGASLDYLNLQTVCRPCHRAKTRAFLRAPRSGRSHWTRLLGTESTTEARADWGAGWFPA